ncbi:hypothetical protein M413DRAFT_22283 [Hebeloma cylindrosporum]|uniref:Uncharacterized protein n=1 Tax=Hebeloma cylindrosporum TaxID=76867 RepID=A0A0C3CUZ3_HEBCY|nr:hypothetical protein M413DRAFT_22283 [Hebeloma cylindrosporum h7]
MNHDHATALECIYSQITPFFASSSPETAATCVRLLRTLSAEALAAADALAQPTPTPTLTPTTPSLLPTPTLMPTPPPAPAPRPRNVRPSLSFTSPFTANLTIQKKMPTTPPHDTNPSKPPHLSRNRPLSSVNCLPHHENISTVKKKMTDFFDSCLGTGLWNRKTGSISLTLSLTLSLSKRYQDIVFADFAQLPTTIATLVNQSIARDGQSDPDSLLSCDLHLHRAQPAQAATLFVDYLHRAIKTIKFMRQWNALKRVPNGRKLKSDHLQLLFPNLHLDRFENTELLQEWEKDHDSDPDARKRAQIDLEELRRPFISRHAYLTKSRNSFLSLYDHISPLPSSFSPRHKFLVWRHRPLGSNLGHTNPP